MIDWMLRTNMILAIMFLIGCAKDSTLPNDSGPSGCVAENDPSSSSFSVDYRFHSYVNSWDGEVVLAPTDSIWTGSADIVWNPELIAAGEVECGIDIAINEPGDSVRYYEGLGTATLRSAAHPEYFANLAVRAIYVRPVYSVPVPIPWVNCTLLGFCTTTVLQDSLPVDPHCGARIEDSVFGEWNSEDNCFVTEWDELSSAGDPCSRFTMRLCPE